MADFGEGPGTCKAKPPERFVQDVLKAAKNFDLGQLRQQLAEQQNNGAKCWSKAIGTDMGRIEEALKNHK